MLLTIAVTAVVLTLKAVFANKVITDSTTVLRHPTRAEIWFGISVLHASPTQLR